MSDLPIMPEADEARTRRDAAIAEFAQEFLTGENEDIYRDLLVTICRLARDGAHRGDAKLLQRAIAELRYALKIFAPFRDVRKISIFGSARTPEGHPDYIAAERFARLIRAHGWMVITGAGDGIMRAGHGGAGVEGSFGVAIRLPFEQRTNDIIAHDAKLVNFRYFFTRKLMFIKEASAVALFPGGFGTQDEGFEALTLVQTGKANLVPIVLCEHAGGTYWSAWRDYVEHELLRNGMISEHDLSLFNIASTPEAGVEEITRFYKVYHTARYVGDDLIIRLTRPVSPQTLAAINDEFAARIVRTGRIETADPHPAEAGEFQDLPRLRLAFDKRNHGLLRRMIDRLNADPDPVV